MNALTIDLYRIETQQIFTNEKHDDSTQTADDVSIAANSNFCKLIYKLIGEASKSDELKYGKVILTPPRYRTVEGTVDVIVYLFIEGLTDDQQRNLLLLVEHAVEYGVFYLNIDSKYLCRSRTIEHKIPNEVMPIVQNATKEYLDTHIGDSIKWRKFTGLPSPINMAPTTVTVRKIPDVQNLGVTQGLIKAKGIVTNFNRSSGQLNFVDQHDKKHEIHFSANSFLSPEHELYYHDTDPSYKRQIEISFRIVESRKELLTLEIEPINTFGNTVQYQTPKL